MQTVTPYVEVTGWPLKTYDELSEEGATTDGVVDLVDALLEAGESAVLCTHRPGAADGARRAGGARGRGSSRAAMLVVHHRRGKVVATEPLAL